MSRALFHTDPCSLRSCRLDSRRSASTAAYLGHSFLRAQGQGRSGSCSAPASSRDTGGGMNLVARRHRERPALVAWGRGHRPARARRHRPVAALRDAPTRPAPAVPGTLVNGRASPRVNTSNIGFEGIMRSAVIARSRGIAVSTVGCSSARSSRRTSSGGWPIKRNKNAIRFILVRDTADDWRGVAVAPACRAAAPVTAAAASRVRERRHGGS